MGSPSAREKANGDWSDYVFAGSRRLARADTYEDRILLQGTNSSAGLVSGFTFASVPGVLGYVVKTGDKLFLRQAQSGAARGGICISFTDSSNTSWVTSDQNGYALNNDGVVNGSWHLRYADLSAYAGKTVAGVFLVDDSKVGAGRGGLPCRISPW